MHSRNRHHFLLREIEYLWTYNKSLQWVNWHGILECVRVCIFFVLNHLWLSQLLSWLSFQHISCLLLSSLISSLFQLFQFYLFSWCCWLCSSHTTFYIQESFKLRAHHFDPSRNTHIKAHLYKYEWPNLKEIPITPIGLNLIVRQKKRKKTDWRE